MGPDDYIVQAPVELPRLTELSIEADDIIGVAGITVDGSIMNRNFRRYDAVGTFGSASTGTISEQTRYLYISSDNHAFFDDPKLRDLYDKFMEHFNKLLAQYEKSKSTSKEEVETSLIQKVFQGGKIK